MTDDGFHVTPLDVRTQAFAKTLRGYDVAGVEEFRNGVAAELERLLRENAVLEEQVRNFREQLKSFRERENAMSEALVVAHREHNLVHVVAFIAMESPLHSHDVLATQLSEQKAAGMTLNR